MFHLEPSALSSVCASGPLVACWPAWLRFAKTQDQWRKSLCAVSFRMSTGCLRLGGEVCGMEVDVMIELLR